MAESKDNIITHGLSGKIGNMLVFSQQNGKTIVRKMPKKRKSISPQQQQQAKRFQEAIIYAKNAVKNPAKKALYATEAKQGVSAYNVAVADLLHAPQIEKIDLSNYFGKIGDKIIVKVTDDFKVASVVVTITNADGSLVEEGNALIDDEQETDWIFTATKTNADLNGDKITIHAYDLADNMAEEENTL